MTTQATLSSKQLLISTAVALLIALVLLFVAILPAEYGKDLTGIGRLIGLQAMGEAKATAQAQVGGDIMHEHERKHRNAVIRIDVKPKEELEYKAVLAKGEPMLYSWTVEGGPVYFEFHGDPTEGEWPKDFYRSYQIKESSTGEHGSFVAPFTGNHGWYFRNLSAAPAVITLDVTGYYTKLGRVGG